MSNAMRINTITRQPAPRVIGLDSSDTPPPPSPLINFARLRVQRLDGDHFTLTLARRPLLCPPNGNRVFFGGEGQHGTPLTILNGAGLAEAAAGTPVCVADAASAATNQVRVLTLRHHDTSDADGVPISPLAATAGRTAAAVMAEKLEGNHCSQMMVLNDSGVLVCDQDAVWWQLQDGGGLGSGTCAAVFVLHTGHFFASSPGSAVLPTLVLGR